MVDVNKLVKKAQQGDVEAFEELVLSYQDRIYGLCYHLTGNYADANDLAQDVFIRAFQAIKGFRNESDFGTWLHRISVNLHINNQRKLKRYPVYSLDAPIETDDGTMERTVEDLADGPEDIIERNEFREIIQTALQDLSEPQRAVIVLREIYGYSYKDIADILQCSDGTVKSRINRARKILQDEIAKLTKKGGYHLPFPKK